MKPTCYRQWTGEGDTVSLETTLIQQAMLAEPADVPCGTCDGKGEFYSSAADAVYDCPHCRPDPAVSMVPGSKPLPDVTRGPSFNEPFLPSFPANPFLDHIRQGGDIKEGWVSPVDPAPVSELVAEAEAYVRSTDPLMMGAGVDGGQPWVTSTFVGEGPISQKEWDDYYSRWGKPEDSEPSAETIAWLKDVHLGDYEATVTYGSNDTEHLMSSPKNAETLLDSILEARGERYGRFADNAGISQSIKFAARAGLNYHALDNDQLEAIDQIAAKISRIVTGDPDYVDNWDDIAGYAKLVADRLRSNG